jgi:hypothetical protein
VLVSFRALRHQIELLAKPVRGFTGAPASRIALCGSLTCLKDDAPAGRFPPSTCNLVYEKS